MSDLFQLAPPLEQARRELRRAEDHRNDCVTAADKAAAESCIAVIAAQVRDLEGQALGKPSHAQEIAAWKAKHGIQTNGVGEGESKWLAVST